ncbi:MAG: 50S ribosomal protein L29 [Saccharolobus sp.]|uniref:Large ribosomal subunit protein uL29 n=8 Tax=Saccharolobus TaxID=2100760 RepID=A0A8F5H0F7_9CREN|nr:MULTISPECIES: 50S ribosomal protein L29 [Sulfolobaceae]ACP38180.1 ribosomal protein L29 [Sulfolobus islandicus M.14.25]ACP55359.1 ribosomal protein L29 [Sulfolobus islandicus M.16.27]ACR42027.1 ribosomal protein L29 [Sulfolobus islandicus M.16.4]ADX82722.1 ribosomal protein L29 [Sulfolobus islandicus HVE10/4]ADX85362.1 ribosomal protein L29 [Sulfolobus islandicus REY15A]
MTVDLEELRKMEKGELLKKVDELRLELMKLRVQARMGTLKNTASIRNTRKDIARILTVLSEKKREGKGKAKVENK